MCRVHEEHSESVGFAGEQRALLIGLAPVRGVGYAFAASEFEGETSVQCPGCGTSTRDGAAFCPRCGTSLTSPPPGPPQQQSETLGAPPPFTWQPPPQPSAWQPSPPPAVGGQPPPPAEQSPAFDGPPFAPSLGPAIGPGTLRPGPPPGYPPTPDRGRGRNRRTLLISIAAAIVVLLAAAAAFIYSQHTNPRKTTAASHSSGTVAATSSTSSSPDFPASTNATPGPASSTATTTAVPVPVPPVYVPQLPRAGQPVPTGLQPDLPVSGSNAISYLDRAQTPLTAAQLVEWQPSRLAAHQTVAIAAIVTFMLDINRNDHSAAWYASTGRYDTRPSDYAGFDRGYRTSRYYQATFGTPRQLAGDLVAVPVRFVSRQNGAAEGDASIPSCTYWPQFVYLVGNRGAGWLPDDVPLYASRPEASNLKRQGTIGQVLNPNQQRSAC